MLHQFNDLIDRCKTTPQRYDYHPEGSVYNHLACVFAGCAWGKYGDDPVLKYAAVFHDLGKPDTTVNHSKYGHLTAPMHDVVGVHLWDFFAPAIIHLNETQKAEVRYIIKQHMRVQKMDRMRPEKQLALIAEGEKASPFAYEKLLVFSGYDDMNKALGVLPNEEGGGVKPMLNEKQLDTLAVTVRSFERMLEVVREQLALRDMERGHIWDRKLAHRGDLVLVRGVSGSGKSTIAEMLTLDKASAIAVSTDDTFTDPDGSYHFDRASLAYAHEMCRARAEGFLRKGVERVVVHNTFTQTWEMLPFMDMADQFGYRVHTVVVENRHGSESVHDVPAKSLKAQRDRFNVIV